MPPGEQLIYLSVRVVKRSLQRSSISYAPSDQDMLHDERTNWTSRIFQDIAKFIGMEFLLTTDADMLM